jgi:hypothetical protein
MIAPHAQWLAGLRGAPQDVSLPILEDLLSQGYVDTAWETNAAAKDGPCISKDGDKQPLVDFVSGLVHAAPFFEKTHVGCQCRAKISGPGLLDVWVSGFGVDEGTPEVALSDEPVPAEDTVPAAEEPVPAPEAEPAPAAEPEEKPAEGEETPAEGEEKEDEEAKKKKEEKEKK